MNVEDWSKTLLNETDTVQGTGITQTMTKIISCFSDTDITISYCLTTSTSGVVLSNRDQGDGTG